VFQKTNQNKKPKIKTKTKKQQKSHLDGDFNNEERRVAELLENEAIFQSPTAMPTGSWEHSWPGQVVHSWLETYNLVEKGEQGQSYDFAQLFGPKKRGGKLLAGG
jgi:hypothetical protein